MSPETADIAAQRKIGIDASKADIENRNAMYYAEQREKIDLHTEELKEGLEKELKRIDKQIAEMKKQQKNLQGTVPLQEMLAHMDEINHLETQRKTKRRDLVLREDELEARRHALQEDIRKRLEGEVKIETIITISFEIV